MGGKASTASRIRDTDQGYTFQEVYKDDKNGKKSQYASDLFGSKKTVAAAPSHVLQAPDWAVAAVKKP